jgi:hypothetical protein
MMVASRTLAPDRLTLLGNSRGPSGTRKKDLDNDFQSDTILDEPNSLVRKHEFGATSQEVALVICGQGVTDGVLGIR